MVPFLGLFTLYTFGMHILSVSMSRYRFPLMSVLAILAALWLAKPHWPEGTLRRVLIGTGVFAYAVLALHYFWVVLP